MNTSEFKAENAVKKTWLGWLGNALGKTLAPDKKESKEDTGFVDFKKYMRNVRQEKYRGASWKKSGQPPQQVYGWRWTDTRLDTAMRRLQNSTKNSQLSQMIQSASRTISPTTPDETTTKVPSSKTTYG